MRILIADDHALVRRGIRVLQLGPSRSQFKNKTYRGAPHVKTDAIGDSDCDSDDVDLQLSSKGRHYLPTYNHEPLR